LLRQVTVRPADMFSDRFPQSMPCRVTVVLKDGRAFVREKDDYEGFYTRPVSWESALKKFNYLAATYADAVLRREIADMVAGLELANIPDLMQLLARVQAGVVRDGERRALGTQNGLH
jgi:2-methylcitrate dehydratase